MLNQKRGKNVAVAGTALQLVMTAVMLAIWLRTDSLAVMSCTWLLAGGIPIWLMAALLFYCRQLARREEMELEELSAAGARTGSVFEGERAEQVRHAAARAAWMERWTVPIFTLLWAGYHAAIGIVMLRYLGGREAAQLTNALQGVLFLVLLALSGFLFGRYAIGMSGVIDWRLLRATGSYLLMNVLFVACATASLIAAHYEVMRVDLVFAYVMPIIQVMLAAELVVNLTLDIYRPRVPGQEQRPSFDSRMLNIAAEPARAGHSIAETLNYQFGFEVSKTWFYRLLRRAFVPLILAGAAVLMGMSSIVIVNEGEVYVIERWRKLDRSRGELGPGIHLKYPWPIETARKFDKNRIKRIWIGTGRQRTEEERKASLIKGREVYLWTEEHGHREEKDFLVAMPPRSVPAAGAGKEGEDDKKPKEQEKLPVNLVKLVIAMDYRITSPFDYGYKFADAEKVLEAVAHRELVHYCANATLAEEIEGRSKDLPGAIMTSGRQAVAEHLRDRISRRAADLGLGVEITYVGVVAAHPPKETAGEYEEISKARRQRDQQRYSAQADASRILSAVAGNPYKALDLAMAIEAKDQLARLGDISPASEEFGKLLGGFVDQTKDYLATLDAQIEAERLQGRFTGDTAKGMQGLRGRYVSHIRLLEEAGKAPERFDFDEAITKAASAADKAFALASGRPVEVQDEATIYRWQTELEYRAAATAFRERLVAYNANRRTYVEDLWLEAWEEALPKIPHKTIIGIDPERVERTYENLEIQRAGMMDLIGESTGE